MWGGLTKLSLGQGLLPWELWFRQMHCVRDLFYSNDVRCPALRNQCPQVCTIGFLFSLVLNKNLQISAKCFADIPNSEGYKSIERGRERKRKGRGEGKKQQFNGQEVDLELGAWNSWIRRWGARIGGWTALHDSWGLRISCLERRLSCPEARWRFFHSIKGALAAHTKSQDTSSIQDITFY